MQKGKNTSGNSGNYIALTNQLVSGNGLFGDLDLSSGLNHSLILKLVGCFAKRNKLTSSKSVQ